MDIATTVTSFLSGLFLCELILLSGIHAARGRKHEAKIWSPPSDIPSVNCGEEIRLTCMAEGQPAPEIEWWYHSKPQEHDEQQQRSILRELEREGRVEIKTEKIYVVKSTLIIKDAKDMDEGLYQCRASNSPVRGKKNINLFQHWKIEQVPVHNVLCEDSSLTTTQVFPAATFNESVYIDAVERTMTTLGVTSSSTTRSNPAIAASEKEDAAFTTTRTVSTTVLKTEESQKRFDPKVNSILKPKEKKKHRKTAAPKSSSDHEENAPIKSKSFTNKNEPSFSEQSGNDDDGRNTGLKDRSRDSMTIMCITIALTIATLR